MASGTSKAVYVALAGNFFIAIFKFIAAFFSGSSSMLAEGYHSISDTLNQVFLLVGISKSKQPPNKLHPYGHGKEQFFWAFVVSMMIFGIAGVLSFREGYHKLLHPEPLEYVWLTFIALGLALIFEGTSLFLAGNELKKQMKKEKMRNIIAAIKHSKDPTVLTVIFEDSLALISIFIAGTAIGLSYYTGNPVYDAIASLIIGGLLMIFSVVLASETKHLLIGESISKYKRNKIIKKIEALKEVNEIIDFRTMHLGPEETLVTMEVNLKDNLLTDDAEKVIDKIEAKVNATLKNAKCYVELEHVPKKRVKKKKSKLFR